MTLIKSPGAALVAMFLACGCHTDSSPGDAPSLWNASGFHPTLPSKPFDGYGELFTYIASMEGIEPEKRNCQQLMVESRVDRVWFKETGALVLVEPHYHGDSGIDEIRGAQGNGQYYVFQNRSRHYRLVGILHGCVYRWNAVGTNVSVITTWHAGGTEEERRASDIEYRWDGNLFQ